MGQQLGRSDLGRGAGGVCGISRNSSAVSLCLTILGCILLPLIHLTGVAMVLPIGAHLLVFNRRQLWKWKWRVVAIVLLCSYLFWPYLAYFATRTQPNIPRSRPQLIGWLAPLVGGQYLTLGTAGTMPGDGWQEHSPEILQSLVGIAQWITRIALLCVWLGMAIAVPRGWKALRHPASAGATQHLCLVALAVWICQTFLDGIERLDFSPQYLAATWMIYIFFAWIAVDWLMQRMRGSTFIVRWLPGIYSGSLLLGIVIIMVTFIRNEGAVNGYFGTSLANQIEAVKRIRQFSDRSNVDIQFAPWRLHPLAYQVLMELNPASAGPRPVASLVVKYRNGYPGDARIEVQTVPLRN